jgi:hypothetical protein
MIRIDLHIDSAELLSLIQSFNVFKSLNLKVDSIMATQQEIITRLDGMTTQLGKVATEVQTILDELAAAGGPGGTVSQALVDAVDRAQAALQLVDDKNPDAPIV